MYCIFVWSYLRYAWHHTLHCLAWLSPTPIFSSSSIAVLMFWPWPPMHVDAHTTLYTLHSIPYTALLGPIPIFSSSSIAFLMFWPSPLMHVKDQPYLTLHSLHSPPQPSPCRLLCLTLLQSFLVILVLPLLFLCFDPPNARPWTDQGGIEPHRHPIATWYIGRKTDHGGHPKWLVNCLKLAGFGTLPPRPPILTSFAMGNFSQAWQLAFVITLHYITLHYITLHYITLHTYIHIYVIIYTCIYM